jgi:transposase
VPAAGAPSAAQNCPAFEWSEKRLRAVALVADDNLSDEQIASAVGVSRRTLTAWKQHPAFEAKRLEMVAELEREVLKLAIAQRHKRVRVLDDLHSRYLAVLEARAADEELRKLPGGEQGLVVKTVKVIGMGKNAQTITEYAVDPTIAREVRALQEQAAKDLGQWSEKKVLEGSDVRPLRIIIDEASE